MEQGQVPEAAEGPQLGRACLPLISLWEPSQQSQRSSESGLGWNADTNRRLPLPPCRRGVVPWTGQPLEAPTGPQPSSHPSRADQFPPAPPRQPQLLPPGAGDKTSPWPWGRGAAASLCQGGGLRGGGCSGVRAEKALHQGPQGLQVNCLGQHGGFREGGREGSTEAGHGMARSHGGGEAATGARSACSVTGTPEP